MIKKILLLSLVMLLLAATTQAASAPAKFSGKLLLAVDRAGELWYVRPAALTPVYLGQPADFLKSMSQVAVGVSEKDLTRFGAKAPARLAGQFLLRTEARGKIAYVNPVDLKIYFFNNQAEALTALRRLALGVKAAELAWLPKENRPTVQVAGVKLLNEEQAVAAARDFINKYLVSAGTDLHISVLGLTDGLYQLAITIAGNQKVLSAISQDSQRFYPQILDIAAYQAPTAADNNAAAAVIPQTAKPTVELFVMSYCPYGTQMEKGILPVAKALGDRIDFQIKFVDYAMHGDKEITENLRQYCIDQEESAKYQDYLQCFLNEADSEACLQSVKVDQNKLKICMTDTDSQFKITALAADQSQWASSYPPFKIQQVDNVKYGVRGSPTLIINGVEANTNRDAASLAKTICAAFPDGQAPTACQNAFSAATPAPGFGVGTTDNTAAASCN